MTDRLFGIGIYSVAEASRLADIPPAQLRQWLNGRSVAGVTHPPLWKPQIGRIGGDTYLGFLDLIQARTAAAMRAAGLDLRELRRAIEAGASAMAVGHPLASSRLLERGRDGPLGDLFGGRQPAKSILEPVFRGVEFDNEMAARWWPRGRSGGVVLDPRRQFGQPIEDETGIPTIVLSQAVGAEGSIAAAARAYLVPQSAIRRALAFEQRPVQKLAA